MVRLIRFDLVEHLLKYRILGNPLEYSGEGMTPSFCQVAKIREKRNN